MKTQGFSLPSNDGGEELFFGIFDKTFAAGDSSLAVGAAMPSDIYCGGIRKALQEKGYRLYFDSPTNQIFVIMKKEILNAMIDLDTDLGTIQKMVSFYTLITASLLLISARLQDIIGKREIFLLGMIIYGVGDLIAALSPNAMVLFIGWSLLEGIGSALMGPAPFPLSGGKEPHRYLHGYL